MIISKHYDPFKYLALILKDIIKSILIFVFLKQTSKEESKYILKAKLKLCHL